MSEKYRAFRAAVLATRRVRHLVQQPVMDDGAERLAAIHAANRATEAAFLAFCPVPGPSNDVTFGRLLSAIQRMLITR